MHACPHLPAVINDDPAWFHACIVEALKACGNALR
jgi:hypothetical protein